MIAAKSASISPEMVPISRCMALCRTVTGLRGHSASDHGDRYALGPFTHDKIRVSCFETASTPYHAIVRFILSFFFLFFFPPFVYVISFFLYSLSLSLSLSRSFVFLPLRVQLSSRQSLALTPRRCTRTSVALDTSGS